MRLRTIVGLLSILALVAVVHASDTPVLNPEAAAARIAALEQRVADLEAELAAARKANGRLLLEIARQKQRQAPADLTDAPPPKPAPEASASDEPLTGRDREAWQVAHRSANDWLWNWRSGCVSVTARNAAGQIVRAAPETVGIEAGGGTGAQVARNKKGDWLFRFRLVAARPHDDVSMGAWVHVRVTEKGGVLTAAHAQIVEAEAHVSRHWPGTARGTFSSAALWGL